MELKTNGKILKSIA